jgi:formylglycine-generating enzyme required for sulfatase activity
MWKLNWRREWRSSRTITSVSCCTPSAGGELPGAPIAPAIPAGAGASVRRTAPISLPGGEFLMGEDSHWSYPRDGEGPVRAVTVTAFLIDPFAVTTEEFAAFIDATGYVTDAERQGWSFVFAGLLPDDFPATRGVAAAPWWRQVHGALWSAPEGPGSDVGSRGEHPVVQVSCRDAAAFALWSGGRLPTEREWEYAARAGAATTFPWGTELEPDGRHMANVWQGRFPDDNTCADGYYGTCPVDAFDPNSFGLSNMIGNVWEWTTDPFDKAGSAAGDGSLTLKGGSFLCHASYCHRYRPAARSGAAPESAASNIGFRCVATD